MPGKPGPASWWEILPQTAVGLALCPAARGQEGGAGRPARAVSDLTEHACVSTSLLRAAVSFSEK